MTTYRRVAVSPRSRTTGIPSPASSPRRVAPPRSTVSSLIPLSTLGPMVIDVCEEQFQAEVVDRSRTVPVVVDFWAEWCGPCRTLTPLLEKAATAREGKVVLAKVDTDANQNLSAAFGIRGIPAVKAFRDGEVVDEFVGVQPPAGVEKFFDGLVPSEADALVAAGDEQSLRRALELDPGRADAAVALAHLLLRRGETDEALKLVEGRIGDFAAEGLAARIRLGEDETMGEAFTALDSGDKARALDVLVEAVASSPDGRREDLRKVVVGI